MGLFDKKYCDICGEKISLLGNRKLDDGNMCSHCAKNMSPFMTDRRHTTVAEMKEHFAYREKNKQDLATFNVYEAYEGGSKKVYIDKAKGVFVVTSFSPDSWDKENPDIIPLSEVTSCNLNIKENRKEEFYQDQQGNRKSYSPPKYKYDYDFYINITLSNRWFNEIEFKLNTFDVEGMNSQRYHSYEITGKQIVSALTGSQVTYTQGSGYGVGGMFGQGVNVSSTGAGLFNAFANQVAQNAQQQNAQQQNAQPQQEAPQAQPTSDWFCQNCGAQNKGKFCENCGTPRP